MRNGPRSDSVRVSIQDPDARDCRDGAAVRARILQSVATYRGLPCSLVNAPSPTLDLDALVARVFAAAENPALLPLVLADLGGAVGAEEARVLLEAGADGPLSHAWPADAALEEQLTCRERVGATHVTLSFARDPSCDSFGHEQYALGSALAWHLAQAFDAQHARRAIESEADAP